LLAKKFKSNTKYFAKISLDFYCNIIALLRIDFSYYKKDSIWAQPYRP